MCPSRIAASPTQVSNQLPLQPQGVCGWLAVRLWQRPLQHGRPRHLGSTCGAPLALVLQRLFGERLGPCAVSASKLCSGRAVSNTAVPTAPRRRTGTGASSGELGLCLLHRSLQTHMFLHCGLHTSIAWTPAPQSRPETSLAAGPGLCLTARRTSS